MQVFVLFAISVSKATPVPMAVVDPNTIEQSNHTEEEYKALVEQAAAENYEEDHQYAGWYTIVLPPDSAATIRRELLNVPTAFPGTVKQDPKAEVHPAINSITVTVGRKPGKIMDDEIR